MKTLFLMSMGVLFADPARAECDGPFSAQDLLGAYQTVQFMLTSGDDEAVVDAGQELEGGLKCLTDRVPPALFAGVYRVLGAADALKGDSAEATKWFLTARQLDASSQFGVDELSFDSPVRALFDAAIGQSAIAPQPVVGKDLAIPEKCEVLLDGRNIREAEATPNRYHLLQLAWVDGDVRRSWVMEGNQFPDLLLQAEQVVEAVPEEEPAKKKRRRKKKKDTELEAITDAEGVPSGYESSDFVRIGRDRPMWKTPSLVSGSVAVIGSVAMYGVSFYARGKYDIATTEDELLHYKQLTNRLSLASSMLFMVGGASTTWGVLMGDSPGVGFQLVW